MREKGMEWRGEGLGKEKKRTVKEKEMKGWGERNVREMF